MICGVDEAGRGPVLGPMVVAAVAIEDDAPLRRMEVRDSKKLTPTRREELAVKINESCQVEFQIISHEEIDARGPKTSLNELEAMVFATLIDRLKADVVYVDACDVNEDHFRQMVGGRLTYRPRMVCEHKADDHYPVVAAASIIAKTNRDRIVSEIRSEIGQEIGSGYASDPTTIAFLQKWIKEKGDLPPYTRRSWATAKEAMSSSKNAKLTDWE
ncbi:MAG TPA: ribonuclease HII [Methanomassiliicoccales archaeon]|jgi:ribonuclease HII